MPIRNNPFGVGFSGQDKWVEGELRCQCCALPFPARYNSADPTPPTWCTQCVEHHPAPGEPLPQRLVRAEAHCAVYKQRMVAMAQTLATTKRELRHVSAEIEHARRDGRQQAAAAYESRDELQEILITVAREHVPAGGVCSCGKRACPTAAAIDRSGRPGRRVRTVAEGLEMREFG